MKILYLVGIVVNVLASVLFGYSFFTLIPDSFQTTSYLTASTIIMLLVLTVTTLSLALNLFSDLRSNSFSRKKGIISIVAPLLLVVTFISINIAGQIQGIQCFDCNTDWNLDSINS